MRGHKGSKRGTMGGGGRHVYPHPRNIKRGSKSRHMGRQNKRSR
jgi:hypothetical protein